MSNIRIPMAVCAAVAEVVYGSHPTLEAKFRAAGAPEPPPDVAHHSKWKLWLAQAGNDPNVDSLAVIGNLIEEFMDLPPQEVHEVDNWKNRRERLSSVLEENGFRYFRGGRVLLNGEVAIQPIQARKSPIVDDLRPSSIEELLTVLVRGLPRAMHPLTRRRKGSPCLSFTLEYDIQDLLHALLRPWVSDIRPEEHTPSYAGSSTRMDFLLPKYKLALETKLIRDVTHGRKIDDELLIDIEHYRKHPSCESLWCIIYDPDRHIPNISALDDLNGQRAFADGSVSVRVMVVG
jgi:hypothetical protein